MHKKEEKPTIDLPINDPKPPIIHSGHMENRMR